MFTGIIEALGTVKGMRNEGSNTHFVVESGISDELKVDQSLSHNGVCLTVTKAGGQQHEVTAVEETLRRTALGELHVGDTVNLERCLRVGDRLDGHFVQGHVDMTATCTEVRDANGSWYFSFQFEPTEKREGLLLVDKGSICVNGVSLTVINPTEDRFSVAIIPYTFEHTTFGNLKAGMRVNLEFDVLGKYISRMMGSAQNPFKG